MARYTKDENGNLILTAGGTRTWIVTQAAHDGAVSAGTAPNNCLVAITDDYPTESEVTSTSGISAITGTLSCTVNGGFSTVGTPSITGGYLRALSGNYYEGALNITLPLTNTSTLEDVDVEFQLKMANLTPVATSVSFGISGFVHSYIKHYRQHTDFWVRVAGLTANNRTAYLNVVGVWKKN